MVHPYFHQIQYYETDKMGITNNTNYIRFMEEARNDYLSQIGFPYSIFERNGIVSPVVKVKCEYKRTTTYPDTIRIMVHVSKLTRFKLSVDYNMMVHNKLVCKASSEHCFLGKNHRIINIKRQLPKFYQKLISEEDKLK